MRKYELIVLYPSEDELFRQGQEAVKALLEKEGAQNVKDEDMGDRILAYEIKKRDRAHYVRYDLDLAPQQVVPIERQFKISQHVLKYLFVRAEN